MIRLPGLFEKTLSFNPALAASVRRNFDLFEPWFEQSGMPFFPGFTDHSPRHINDVLQTAAALISDSSYPLLSADDVAVLVTAILLHDCGMHLTQDGFRALITNKASPLVNGLGDIPWNQLWIDFLGEAQRFGEERLQAVFGDTVQISPDKMDLDNLSERDCLLIGEFVRRHHARLAHEIAIVGVPTLSTKPLSLHGLDGDIKDLAGLVARSHGRSIRSTFPYLDDRYARIPEQRRVKTPFLMAVLRIADYVQVQSERALKTLLSVKELRSPVSRQEWRNHFSVNDVTTRHEDPEAMYVHASPVDVKTFLRLESLFKDIQHELDESWATIGEVYGRFGDLSQLGLTIRRLRSNLDLKEKFASTVSYLPIRAGFQSSGPDLLKLLVGPLYDYSYAVGVRELIQNAVDACRELADIQGEPTNDNNPGRNVVVQIQESEDGTGWLTVTDGGVGMTQDTVIKYFLVAGASFRNSDVWKKQHTDADGQIRVVRGGRFGIGALAAFLMGDEIHVRTRHFDRDESSGVEFSARMDDPIVELRRCPAPAGTTIKVWIGNPEVMKAIRPYIGENEIQQQPVLLTSWRAVDWFAQTWPKVRISWDGYLKSDRNDESTKFKVRAQFHPQEALVPNNRDGDPKWNSLSDPLPYKALLWQYPEAITKKNGATEYSIFPQKQIVVNGIRVQSIHQYQVETRLRLPQLGLYEGPNFFIIRPSLAIYDPTGSCPINLQRSAVSFERMGKDVELAKGILWWYLDNLAKALPNRCTLRSYAQFCKEMDSLQGVEYPGRLLPPVAATSDGFFLASHNSFQELEVKKVFFVQGDGAFSDKLLDLLLEAGEVLFVSKSHISPQSSLAWFRACFGDANTYMRRASESGFPELRHIGEAAIMNHAKWENASEKGKVSRDITKRITLIERDESVVRLKAGKSERVGNLLQRIEAIYSDIGSNNEIYGWVVDGTNPIAKRQSLLIEMWEKKNKGYYLKASG